MNRCLANGFGRRPGPFGIRRVDNEDLQTQDYVASIAGNHPVKSGHPDTGSFTSPRTRSGRAAETRSPGDPVMGQAPRECVSACSYVLLRIRSSAWPWATRDSRAPNRLAGAVAEVCGNLRSGDGVDPHQRERDGVRRCQRPGQGDPNCRNNRCQAAPHAPTHRSRPACSPRAVGKRPGLGSPLG